MSAIAQTRINTWRRMAGLPLQPCWGSIHGLKSSADPGGGGIFGGMETFSSTATTVAVDPRHVSYTHVMYALHAVSVLTGAAGSAFIATYFVFGLPSIIAVVMNYVRRPAVRGTWLESHFRWQLRTFWLTLLVLVLLSPL